MEKLINKRQKTTNDFRRYSVVCSSSNVADNIDILLHRVSAVGGLNTVRAVISHQVFASLTDVMVTKLKRSGLEVTRVQNLLPVIVSVPPQIVGIAEYSPEDMLDLLGLNSFKLSTTPPLTGAGYVVAVVDTGILSTHRLLGGKVVYQENFTNDPAGDGFDHGTGVAAIIHAVVPDADILDMKVLDSTGNGTEENVVLALEACAALLDTDPDIAPNVINLSLGSPDDGNFYNTIRVVCRAVMERGIVIVAAAGNGGAVEGAVTAPACEEYVVAVGSVSSSPFLVSEFSSRGPTRDGLTKPDAVFLGEDIILASSGDDVVTISKSGTSFSAPFTTSVIVLTMEGVMRTHTISPEQFVGKNVITNKIVIENMLPAVCMKPEGVPAGKDNDYGYGVPAGSMIQDSAAQTGLIDWGATMNLFVAMMMMQMMAKMMMSVQEPT